MKRSFRILLSTLLAVAMLLSMSATAFASDNADSSETNSTLSEDTTVTPRSILGYGSVDFTASGPTQRTFTITISSIPLFNWTANQFTVKTSGFKSDTFITVNITNSAGQAMISTYSIEGNKELENQGLSRSLAVGTYTVTVEAFDSSFLKSDNGCVEVWLY